MYQKSLVAASQRTSAVARLTWFSVVMMGCSALSQTACSRQPELISPAAKAEPEQEDSATTLVVDQGKKPAPNETGVEEAIAAKPKTEDSGVKPATHVVDVKLPTKASRSKLDGPAKIAKVLMSEAEQKLCKLNVGDQIPTIALPNLAGQETKVADLTGDKLTVLVFWNPTDEYSTWQLADLTGDVLGPYESSGVNVVSICSGSKTAPVDAAAATAAIEKANAKYPTLLDTDGGTLAQFGTDRTSRTYLIDAEGKILWFDMEYSRSTRRDMKAALSYVIDGPPKVEPVPAATPSKVKPAKVKPASKKPATSKPATSKPTKK